MVLTEVELAGEEAAAALKAAEEHAGNLPTSMFTRTQVLVASRVEKFKTRLFSGGQSGEALEAASKTHRMAKTKVQAATKSVAAMEKVMKRTE